MARRPDLSAFDKPLNRDELAQLTRRLAVLSPHNVLQAYREAHQKCAIATDNLPAARSIQELVTTWKLLREWRKRGPLPRG